MEALRGGPCGSSSFGKLVLRFRHGWYSGVVHGAIQHTRCQYAANIAAIPWSNVTGRSHENTPLDM
jgi:hypothetical protein